jgi:hypothetical protein
MNYKKLRTVSPLFGFLTTFVLTYLFSLTPIWQLSFIAGFLGSLICARSKWSPWISGLGIIASWGIYLGIKSAANHSPVFLDNLGEIVFQRTDFGWIFILIILSVGGILGILSGYMAKIGWYLIHQDK